MKKAFIVFGISIMLICTACGKTSKDKAPKTVLSGAEYYIRNKYGIKAEAIDSWANYEWEGFDFIIPQKKYSGTYDITMRAGDREFTVYAVGDHYYKDDYQFSEINEGLKHYFAEKLPSQDIEVTFSAPYLSEYVDCTYIENILDEHISEVNIYLIDEDINSKDYDEIKNFARNCKSSIELFSCRSTDSRNSLINGRYTMPRGDAASKPTALGSDYAVHVKEVWNCRYISGDDTHIEEYNKLNIDHFGDLYYTIPENAEVTVTNSEKKYYSEKYSDEKHKLITPAFDLKCSENFTVFFPVELADDIEPELGQTYKCCGNQVDIIGDYFVYRIHTKQWYADNHYYGEGDGRFFGVYIDSYY